MLPGCGRSGFFGVFRGCGAEKPSKTAREPVSGGAVPWNGGAGLRNGAAFHGPGGRFRSTIRRNHGTAGRFRGAFRRGRGLGAGRGAARFKKDDYDGAITDCTEALRLDPKLTDAYVTRAAAKREKGDQAGADADEAARKAEFNRK